MEQTTSYDYDDLLGRLKRFMQSQDEFKDMDFDGAAINALLRLLAYNTSLQGFSSNFLFNELDLNTAVLRENAASRASSIGYLAQGYRGAKIKVTVKVTPPDLSTAPPTLVMDRKETFFATKDGKVVQFSPSFPQSADLNSDGVYLFENIELTQGLWTYNSYTVQGDFAIEKFSIPNAKADTSTMEVLVYESATSDVSTVFNQFRSAMDLGMDSPVYFLRTGRDGLYSLNFGDGRASKAVSDGNVAVVAYITSEGASGNGISLLTPGSGVGGFFDVEVESLGKSYGGADPESIESIRLNAPMSFASRGSAVGFRDYIPITKEVFPEAELVNAWGGEDHEPPMYGYVMLAVKPRGALTLTPDQKADLVSKLSKHNIGSITPTVVDIDWTFINGTFDVWYDAQSTILGQDGIRGKVRTNLDTYSKTRLETFNSEFDSVDIATFVKSLDSSIKRVDASFWYSKKFSPEINVNSAYDFNFNQALKPGTVRVHGFRMRDLDFEGYVYEIVDDGAGVLRLQKYLEGLANPTPVLLKDFVGTVNYTTGLVKLSSFQPNSLTQEFVNVDAYPDKVSEEQHVFGSRDILLTLGTANVNPRIYKRNE